MGGFGGALKQLILDLPLKKEKHIFTLLVIILIGIMP